MVSEHRKQKRIRVKERVLEAIIVAWKKIGEQTILVIILITIRNSGIDCKEGKNGI